MGDGGVVFETPLGKQLHNVNNWSEIFTALRDSLKEGADTSNNAHDEKWSFVTSGSGSGSSNHTLLYDVVVNDDRDTFNSTAGGDTHHRRHRPDIYLILVIGTVALLVLGVLCFAFYKAVQRLLKTNSNSNEVSVEAAAANAAEASSHEAAATAAAGNNQSNHGTNQPSTSSSGTLTRLANGFRNFQAANLRLSATLRSTASTKSDDNPPPYEDDLPPSYEAALKMGTTLPVAVMTSCRSSSSSLSSAAAATAGASATSAHSTPADTSSIGPPAAPPPDETDGGGKKHNKKTNSKFNFSVV